MIVEKISNPGFFKSFARIVEKMNVEQMGFSSC